MHLILFVGIIEARVKQGFYIGGVLDYSSVSERSTFGRQWPSVDTSMTAPYKNQYGSFGGGLLAGCWLALFGESNPFRIGVEGVMRMNKQRSETFTVPPESNERIRDSISFPYSWGLRVQMGAVLGKQKDWLLYGFVGAVLTQVSWSRAIGVDNLEKSYLLPPHTPNGVYFPFTQVKRKAKGFEVGIGVEKEIWKGHRLGLEASRTMYNKMKFNASDLYEPTVIRANTYEATNTIHRVSMRYIIPM